MVDDDDDIVWMLTAVLRKHFDVVNASSGLLALKELERSDFAAVITDHMMPGMTGVELLDRSLALRPAAARVLLTASDRVQVFREAVNQARVHRFLTKPLPLKELPKIVGEAIREAELEHENSLLVAELEAKNAELNRANERLEEDVRQRTRELQEAVDKLEELALKDGLTGLFNHRYLQEALEAEIARAGRHGHPVGLLFLDVDNFKLYNDANGHPAGDRVLREIGWLLTGGGDSGIPLQARRSDIAARYGGEEFVMILPETSLEGVLTKAERIRRAIAEHPFEHREKQPLGCVSVSIGAAVFPEHGDNKQSLIDVADRELYRAKHGGRNRVCAPEGTG
ncbi:MAG: diguanylate cyclase [Myxococcales bacterium]|nr:diguanylate cyclase [Myxococcales bacterium]